MNRLEELRRRHRAAELGGGEARKERQHKEGKLSMAARSFAGSPEGLRAGRSGSAATLAQAGSGWAALHKAADVCCRFGTLGSAA